MGGTRYSDAIYESRVETARSSGRDYFEHDEGIRRGERVADVHEKLDPKKENKAGKIIRESFDSDAAPLSRAIAVLFDNTGSMSTVPRIFKDRLPKLMAALVKKGFIPDPHILFGAIGDATLDRVPLQVGQFEGGNEMDEALANIYLEGGGGPYSTESYELAMYFMARHTDIDCLKKRGQKGILFISGDELPYPKVKHTEVQKFIGDSIQDDIALEDILKELRDKFEVFWILPRGSSGWGHTEIEDPLNGWFGQNLLRLEEPGDICELIVSTIGVLEGYDLHDVGVALKDVGSDKASIDRTSRALVPLSKSRGLAKAATASGALVETGADDTARL